MRLDRFFGVLSIVALLAAPATTFANVYPSALRQSANSFNPGAAENVTLNYVLNEDATGVTIDILNSSSAVVKTFSPGAQVKGTQSVIWDGTDNSAVVLPDGDYSFRVTSTGTNRTSWSPIFTDVVTNNFFLPRGVAVNKNANSPYYGRVYVTESGASTTSPAPPNNTDPVNTAAGRSVTSGVYMVNADLTDTGIAGGTGVHTGGVTWIANSQSSPYKVAVGPDDSVYVTDWADAHSGLWQAPGDLSGTWTEALDNTARAASGLNATHGSISDVVVTGTGANRKIYTADEDFIPAGGSTGSVPRYDIGTQTTFTGAPSGFAYVDGVGADTTVNRIQNFQNGMAFDNAGNLWLTQNRSVSQTGTLPSLIQIDPSGAVIFASVPDLAASTIGDPLRGNFGIDYDPFTGLLAVATAQNVTGGQGLVILFDTISKTIIDQFTFDATSATTNTDVAFDALGNLIVTNRTKERVRVWAPPNTLGYRPTNESSTDSLIALGAIAISSVAPGLDGDFNNDGTVDAADYVMWAKTMAGDMDAYGDWVENFGESQLGSGGNDGGTVPEPSGLLIVMIGLLGASCRCRRSA
jgi:hypothetical protein